MLTPIEAKHNRSKLKSNFKTTIFFHVHLDFSGCEASRSLFNRFDRQKRWKSIPHILQPFDSENLLRSVSRGL